MLANKPLSNDEVVSKKIKEIIAQEFYAYNAPIEMLEKITNKILALLPPTLSDEEIEKILPPISILTYGENLANRQMRVENVDEYNVIFKQGYNKGRDDCRKVLSGRIPAQQEVDNPEQKCECGKKRIYWHCHICNSEYWLCPHCGLASKCLNPPPFEQNKCECKEPEIRQGATRCSKCGLKIMPLPQQDRIDPLRTVPHFNTWESDDTAWKYIDIQNKKINEIIAHNNQRRT